MKTKIVFLLDKYDEKYDAVTRHVFLEGLSQLNYDVIIVSYTLGGRIETDNKRFIKIRLRFGLVDKLFNSIVINKKIKKTINDLNENDLVIVRNDIRLFKSVLKIKKKLNFKLGFRYSFPRYLKSYIDIQNYSARIKLRFHRRLMKRMIIEDKFDFILPISNCMFNQTLIDFSLEELKGKFDNKLFEIKMGLKMNQSNKIHKIENSNRFVYLGSTEKDRDLGFIINSFSKAKIASKSLLIIGGETPQLLDLIEQYDLKDKVTITGRVDYNQVYEHLVSCDIGLSIVPPMEYFICSSPTKFYEYINAGLKVIANKEILEHSTVFTNFKYGIITEYKNYSLTKAMEQIVLKDNLIDNDLKKFKMKNSYDEYAEKLNEFLKTI